MVVVLNAHGSLGCCPELCPSCAPRPIHCETFSQRPFGYLGKDVQIRCNVWAAQPGGFPQHLRGRVSEPAWQQFIADLNDFLAMGGLEMGASERLSALQGIEQRHGPQLGATFIGNGVYDYEALKTAGPRDGDPGATYYFWPTKHYIRLEFAPAQAIGMGAIGKGMGGAPVAAMAVQQMTVQQMR